MLCKILEWVVCYNFMFNVWYVRVQGCEQFRTINVADTLVLVCFGEGYSFGCFFGCLFRVIIAYISGHVVGVLLLSAYYCMLHLYFMSSCICYELCMLICRWIFSALVTVSCNDMWNVVCDIWRYGLL